MKIIIESCIETLEEILHAQENGADQLEVCSNLELGGLTPDIQIYQKWSKKIKIPCKIMIRNKSEDFYYSKSDINKMCKDIEAFKKLKVDGFVFGALKKSTINKKELDLDVIRTLTDVAFPTPITIHKAIDECTDIIGEVIKLKEFLPYGFILSSGGQKTALEGASLLRDMNMISKNIKIIAAGKVTKANLPDIINLTGLSYFHGRKIA